MTADLLSLGSSPGPTLQLSALGATVRRLQVTGADGLRRDVVLGFATDEDYLSATEYVGATIGCYANRIAAGRFVLDGREVRVGVHDRGNHLHGGPDGFDRRVWQVLEADDRRAVLGLVSPDGDQGFPGRLTARAAYSVTDDAVQLELTATTDAPTLVNLTSHVYLNLAGAGSIDDHRLQVPADRYTPVDPTGIPTGGTADVAGTPFDLREPRRLGDVARSAHPQVRAARGLDHDLVPNGAGWRRVARLTDPDSDTAVDLWSDQPGLQVYTGNFLDGARVDRGGRLLRQGDGLCLEPQRHPDTPNREGVPSAVLRPGEVYRARMAWVFGAVRART